MKKLLTYIIVFVIVGTGIISCNTDIEALDIVVPDKMSKEYWENLRAYKARNDHEVFFGWFGGWTANSADMINYLRSVPDSVDIISIWGAYQNLSPAQMEDLRYVQDVKGTRVTYTIFAHKIPDEFMSGENHEIATPEGIEEYVVEGVSEIFTMVASLKNIKIVQDVPVENVAVRADIDMIKTVIRNLISNAIKFSNEGSEVVVSLAEEDGMAIVSVKDSGCGIDDENQKKLLHTDTHFSTFGTNNEEGSGLGLLLCQDFVVKNGGKLWFTSKKGDGSTFSFSIPLLEK